MRPADRILVGYLLLTAAAIAAFHGRGGTAWLAPLHVVLAMTIALVASRRAEIASRSRALAILWDWYPASAVVGAYTEFRVLAHLRGDATHDATIVALEGSLFGCQPSQTLRTALPWPWLSELVHFCYVSYYWIPFSLPVLLSIRGDAARFSEALTAILGAFFTCCVVYVFFPVAGPYHHFGHRAIAEIAGVVPRLANRIVRAGSSIGTAFPSSHTAVAVSVWLASWRLERRLFWVLSVVVPGLALGTVYGGFHYAVDTIAGATTGAAAVVAAARIHRSTRAGFRGTESNRISG